MAAREPVAPDPAAFAALRSPDPRAWLGVAGFERLLEELPDVRTGLSRSEREILEALAAGPLTPPALFAAVAVREDPPWLGDATRPPVDRWLGGVHLGPGHADWAWDPASGRPIRLD